MTYTELIWSKQLPDDSGLAVLLIETATLLDGLCLSKFSVRLRNAFANYLHSLPDKSIKGG